jgi:peptidoglycan biosynthesis protein MviN/MurJ (putative lipid II flippase)
MESPLDIPWQRRIEQGLNTSVHGNAQAFGFSITITVTFGVVSLLQPRPQLVDLFLFALAGVLAFSLLNVLVVLRLRRHDRGETNERGMLLGTATDFLAVGAAVGAAMGVEELVHGTWAWLLGPFVAAMAYVLVQAVELAFGRRQLDPGRN